MNPTQYLYFKIYKELLSEIQNGVYKNKRLPTEKEISDNYQVSRITSRRAMNMLVEDGIVVRTPGIGTFVVDNYCHKNQNESQQNEVFLQKKRQEVGVVEGMAKRKTIGLVIEAIGECFGMGIFDGIYAEARNLEYDLIIKKTYGNQDLEIEVIEELLEAGVVGILIIPAHGDCYNREILKLVVEEFPIVFLDRYLNGIPVPFVGSNNIQASEDCVIHHFNNGHQKIALITGAEQGATTIAERKVGYINGHLGVGLQVNKDYIFEGFDYIIPNQFNQNDFEKMSEVLQEFLAKNFDLTAVVATEYLIGVITKLAADKIGKRVPEDLNIICFDSPKQYHSNYEFTHVQQDEEKVGKEAVNMLHQCILQGKIAKKIHIPTTIVEGSSTSCIKGE